MTENDSKRRVNDAIGLSEELLKTFWESDMMTKKKDKLTPLDIMCAIAIFTSTVLASLGRILNMDKGFYTFYHNEVLPSHWKHAVELLQDSKDAS